MNAQQSELLNKVMKQLVHNLSSHVHVNGEERDMRQHYASECFRALLHEFITKELAFELGMVHKSTFNAKDTSVQGQSVAPSGVDCSVCGVDLKETKAEHDHIHNHPLFQDVMDTGTSCTRQGLVALLMLSLFSERPMLQAAQRQEQKQETKKTTKAKLPPKQTDSFLSQAKQQKRERQMRKLPGAAERVS